MELPYGYASFSQHFFTKFSRKFNTWFYNKTMGIYVVPKPSKAIWRIFCILKMNKNHINLRPNCSIFRMNSLLITQQTLGFFIAVAKLYQNLFYSSHNQKSTFKIKLESAFLIGFNRLLAITFVIIC